MTISLHLRPAVGATTAEGEPDHIQRFDTHQRIQHLLMMSSFVVLALTGLPQRFSELGISQWWVESLGGLERTRSIHRAAGLVMVLDCIYHVTYLSYRIGVQGKTTPLQMIPTLQDARDAIHMARYFLGAAPDKPKFGRFSYLEKFDYWAVFWGMAVIGGSGLVLMFHVAATRFLPGEVLPLAETLHGDEAILATGWIAIVHMFNAHLAPWVFPFNPAIFTGKLSRERYEEDHPLEYDRIAALEQAARTQVAPTGTQEETRARPAEEPSYESVAGRSWETSLAAIWDDGETRQPDSFPLLDEEVRMGLQEHAGTESPGEAGEDPPGSAEPASEDSQEGAVP